MPQTPPATSAHETTPQGTPDTAPALEPEHLEALLSEHRSIARPRQDRLWAYYRNPTPGPGDIAGNTAGEPRGGSRLAQAQGLPARLRRPGRGVDGQPARETVIENDIAWRVHALVDFVFGRAPVVQSLHPDPRRARQLERFLRAVLHRAGGPGFFQTLGLLGSVYGHADVLLRIDEDALDRDTLHAPDPDDADAEAEADELELPVPRAEGFHLDPVEATRGIPVLSRHDYRQLDAYLIHTETADRAAGSATPTVPGRFLQRVRQHVLGQSSLSAGSVIEHTTLYTPERIERFSARPTAFASRRTLVASEENALGRIPLVHIQNLPQPFMYAGLSDVEPLIPLQDELNTRLSDRANRVTFQSFKMYLGKGIDGFTDRPVGPGQMWSTDNPDASIEVFGGDADSPSETAHIAEIREAMDKASAVPPIAAGLLRDRIGSLTSENALRVVLMGLLAKAQKKQTTYGSGLGDLCELILHAANVAGVLPNDPEERAVRFDWPDPLPPSHSQALRDAERKLALGVPRKQVLAELGYEDEEGGRA